MAYLLIIIIAFSVYAIISKRKEKQKRQAIEGNKIVTVEVNVEIPKDVDSTEIERIEKRRERLRIRSDRRERHGRIWSILFFLSSYNDCTKEYYTKRELRYYKTSLEEVWNRKPDKDDIETAIRFCKIENKRGNCDHEIVPMEIEHIYYIRQFVKTELKRFKNQPDDTLLPPSSFVLRS